MYQIRISVITCFTIVGNRIGGVLVSVLVSIAVDRGFEPRSDQTKDYKIGICCFSANQAGLKRKSRDWLACNHDNVSEWRDMFIRGLLFQWTLEIVTSFLYNWCNKPRPIFSHRDTKWHQTPLPFSFLFGHCVVCPFTDSDYPFGILKLFLQNVRSSLSRLFISCVSPLLF